VLQRFNSLAAKCGGVDRQPMY